MKQNNKTFRVEICSDGSQRVVMKNPSTRRTVIMFIVVTVFILQFVSTKVKMDNLNAEVFSSGVLIEKLEEEKKQSLVDLLILENKQRDLENKLVDLSNRLEELNGGL